MSKIVFFCIPAHGHTNPTLGVVRELIARGHEIWYYSYEALRDKIEATGAHFVPCDEYDPQIGFTEADNARIGKDLAFSTEIIVSMTLALDDVVSEQLRILAPDLIVGDSMAFWAKLIAHKLDIPFVSSTTTFAFNRYSARVMKQGGGGLLKMLFAMPKINRQLARLREKGYAVKSVLDIIQNDNETETIVYTSREFQPCAETFSAHYHFVGPILRPAETRLEEDGRPIVYISLGTVDNAHLDFYLHCIEALRDEPYRVLISVGRKTDIAALGILPEHISVAPSVDQMAVLKAADVFLTHCGMNSVSEGLYHAVPLLLFPVTPEQQGVANRVLALGAGIRLMRDDPNEIRSSIGRVLADAGIKAAAQEISKGFHRAGGAKAAADAIERASLRCRSNIDGQ